MLLRRLNDLLPALCRGFESPETGFEPYAAQIARELEWLRIHPVQVELSDLCPLDFLLLFRPDRRTAVLNGKADIFDFKEVSPRRSAYFRENSSMRFSNSE